MLSHEFVYPRVTPLPARTDEEPRTPQGPSLNGQRDLVMASLIRCPRSAPGSRGNGQLA
jgi:hypothetical protein